MKDKQVSTGITSREVMKTGIAMVCKCKLLLLFLLAGFVACSESARQNDTKVIENDQIRLVFATKPVPFLKELVQKHSQKNLLPEPADQNLFTLEISQPEGKNLTVESRSAKKGSVKISRNKKSQSIMIRFTGLGPAKDIQVNINGVLDNEEPIVQWSIKVNNPGKQKIVTVRFPCVAAVPAIGSSEDDFIVAPAFPGAMIENPAKNLPENYSAGWLFPGQQSAQFLSYQDRTAGIYMSSMDTVGYNRGLRIAKQGNKLFILSQEYNLPESPETKWESPYDVALGVTSGTWQQTADIYKKWAVRQFWCAKTLTQRNDIPDFWKQGPCVHLVSVRVGTNEKEDIILGSYYQELPEHLRFFRKLIDGPVVPLLVSWENRRRWNAGNYFPVFDADRAKEALRQVRQDGFHPFVYLSGLFYTFRYQDPDSSLIPGSERYTSSFVISKTGEPLINEGTVMWMRRFSYSFCPSVPETKKFFRSVLDQLHALGIDLVQIDQAVHGAGQACYSTTHGHQPGPGPYQSQDFRGLLYDMRVYGKSLSPDFMLTVEELHEELIPYVDGFHAREHVERNMYRANPGTRGIPLFTYLYHEYAIAYGGDIAVISKDKNPKLVRDHAVNLVTGKTPAVAIWNIQKAIYDVHSDQIHMLRNHSHILKTEARRFLLLGRMLHSLEFDVPSVTFQIGYQQNSRNPPSQPFPFEERAVLTSSWQSPEGNVGHCLVNITDAKQQARLQLDTRNAPGWPKVDVDLYRADKPETCEHVLRGVSLPHEYILELVPLETVFFVIRPAR